MLKRRLKNMGACALMALSAMLSAPVHAEQGGSEEFTVAVTGDLLGPYRAVSHVADAEMEQVFNLIRSADVAFANQEGSVFDLSSFLGYPAAENGGGTPVSNPAIGPDLKAIGFDLLSKSNNHATDWGMDGMLASVQSLEAAGLVTAGAGKDENAARAPGYFDSAKGKVALVATASTFTPMSVPANRGTKLGIPINARPGISVVRTDSAVRVSASEMKTLRAIAGRGRPANADKVRIGRQGFVVSDQKGLAYSANEKDVAALLDQVREAKQKAGFVIFSIHAHETASGGSEDTKPADFLPELFHKIIDAGADMVVRHGPHALHGVEIYKGRPIFYSMGSIYFDFGAERSLTTADGRVIQFPDSWYESAVAVASYEGGRLSAVKFHPVLIESSDRPTAGAPRPATGEDARRILTKLQADSDQFGTKITIEDGVGVIRTDAGN